MTDVAEEVQALRKAWGERLLVLGHHYQASDVVALCDAVGDSLELARIAAASTAERIVFCGVRFMAETADVLVRRPDGSECGRRVYQPVPEAGCPMADMAEAEPLEAVWAQLTAADPSARWVPVVYVNSSVEVKAFCARHGGSACTSGNGKRVVRHFLEQGFKIFFAPDRYLSANIMRELGHPAEATALWRRALPDGGLSPEAIRRAKLVAWDGYCPTHAGFTPEVAQAARAAHPEARLLLHPEVPEEAAKLADGLGSTKAIIEAAEAATPGETLLVGTEWHLVERLAKTNRHVKVLPLRELRCPNMGKTRPEDVLAVLRDWPERCRVRVPEALAREARQCVERMLAL